MNFQSQLSEKQVSQKIKIAHVYYGKVRDCAELTNATRIIRTSDRISAFDMMMPFLVPNKGACLQRISLAAFNETKDILPNHVLQVLDERTILATQLEIIPIEFIMRRFVTGSLWRLYRKHGIVGVNEKYGLNLEDHLTAPPEDQNRFNRDQDALNPSLLSNLNEHCRLARPVFTPTHKALEGHDEPLHLDALESTLANFLTLRKITSVTPVQLKEKLLTTLERLFLRGEESAAEKGLILVDTKYEIGLAPDGSLVLADEAHTPDSSRYWHELPQNGKVKQLSKEFLREELMGAEIIENDDLTHDGIERLRAMAPELAAKIAARYQELASLFLGNGNAESPVKAHWPLPESQFEEAIAPASRVQKLFIAGNGGRDFTLMSRFSTLPSLRQVYNWPGERAWKSRQVPVVNLAASTFHTAINHAAQGGASQGGLHLVIAGPEIPIAQGIKAACVKEGIPCLAPGLKGAALEASKIICKQALLAADIPTAEFEILSYSKLEAMPTPPRLPCVLKFDGLASGKGVFIISSNQDWLEAKTEISAQIKGWMCDLESLACETASKNAGEPLFLIETCLTGEEYSIFALCNGTDYRLLPVARDYKRRNDNQCGPNTGGMGAVAPIKIAPSLLVQFKTAIEKILAHQVKTGEPYQGFLFGGFMVDHNGHASVLEFNCRLGDPETQVILPGLSDDFLLECYRTAAGLEFFWKENTGTPFQHDGLSRVFLVGAQPEYPEKSAPYRKLRRINSEDTHLDSGLCTLIPSAIEADGRSKGGRAFGILARSQQIQQARALAYEQMNQFLLDEIKPHYRKDIAAEW